MRDERGQVMPVVVALVLLLVAGGALLAHLARIGDSGGRGQTAADVAAIAAARTLGTDPSAPGDALRSTAARAATDNGATLVSFDELGRGGLPAGVRVVVTVGAGGDRVRVTALAGVSFAAALPSGGFRPVDLHGLTGRSAVVAAAAAQIGWPYVWGGESRAEGGFDCSGLVDFAYAAAGIRLPGRPTAAELWSMGRPIAAQQLGPGDLVFEGAGSGAPYHVGIYAGEGAVIVAPHTGAQVRFEPLAAGGWDGFATLGAPVAGAPADALVLRAARDSQVPSHVLAAELRLGLATDPAAAGRALAAAMAAHPSSLEDALTMQLGDRSAAALVLRDGSGPAVGLAADVRLLPRSGPGATGLSEFSGLPLGAPTSAADVAAARAAAGGASWSSRVGTVLTVGEIAAEAIGERGSTVGVQALAGVSHLGRFGLTILSTVLPGDEGELAGFAGSVWDAVDGFAGAYAEWGGAGLALGRWGLLAARLNVIGGALSTGVFGYQALTAGRRRDRIGYGLEAVGSGVATAGLLTAGSGLVPLLAVGAVAVPPVGLAAIGVGATLICAGYLYRHPEWCRAALRIGGRALDLTWEAETAPIRVAASLGRSAVGAARSVIDAIPTPWG